MKHWYNCYLGMHTPPEVVCLRDTLSSIPELRAKFSEITLTWMSRIAELRYTFSVITLTRLKDHIDVLQ